MKLVLIRHGEPTYKNVQTRGFIGQGRDLAELTKKGKQQALETAKDRRLIGADALLTSPYTRTMETAAIIGHHLNMPLTVETDLHEWISNLSFTEKSNEFFEPMSKEFGANKGECTDECVNKWESLSAVAERAINVFRRYSHLNKVIAVTHGMLIRQFKYASKIPHCGIVEIDFDNNFQREPYHPELEQIVYNLCNFDLNK